MKKSSMNIGIIFLLALTIIFSGCDKNSPTKPDQLEVIGLVITQSGKTQVSYKGNENVVGELEVAQGQLSDALFIKFIDADQSVFTPSENSFTLGYELADTSYCKIYQHEGKEGGFEFHLDARNRAHGHTTVIFKLIEKSRLIFTSKPIPIHVESGAEEVYAWIWAFDGSANALHVYHSVSGEEKANFPASAHPMMHIIHAGPEDEPTIWMANQETAYAFTAGFHGHGDHAHMEIPEAYKTIPVGKSPTHTGVSPDGMTVAFANDGDQTVSVIDVSIGTVKTISHGSGHSAAMLTGSYLITTAATSTTEKWAKIVDIPTNTVAAQIEIGTGAHGDAYYAAGNTAFIACSDGFYVVDVAGKSLKKSIPYTQPGRTNFLYHGENAGLAVGLHKTDAGTSDKILLLDLAGESLEYLTISGATLDWKIKEGHFALSQNGQVAVLADLTTPKIYWLDLQARVIRTLTASTAGAALALNYDGSQVWALDRNSLKVSQIHAEHNDIEKEFIVAAGTEWLFVTSFDGTVTGN